MNVIGEDGAREVLGDGPETFFTVPKGVFSLLSDDDLKAIARGHETVLNAALDKLDKWQRARAHRLFPDLPLSEEPGS